MIFTRARVSLALLSLRKNGGLLEVYVLYSVRSPHFIPSPYFIPSPQSVFYTDRDYELEQFFRSLRDLLMLSLEANLSFDSAEFLSRRLDGFERTLNVLSSRLRVSFPTEVQLLVNRGSIARTYLIWVCV